MRPIAILALVLLCNSASGLDIISADRLAALPPEAAAIIKPFQRSATVLIDDARRQVDEKRHEHVTDLVGELEKYTRRGKLEPVQAIQARIDQLAAGSGAADLLGPATVPTAPAFDGEAPPLPSTAARKVAAYEKALERLAFTVAKEIYSQRDKAIQDLAKLMSSLTKAGDIDKASLVQIEHAGLIDLYLAPDFLGPFIPLPIGGHVILGDVALLEHGATVSGGNPAENLIDGNSTDYNGHSGYTSGSWPCSFTTDLQKLYALSQIRLLLWDGGDRYYQYTLEVSPDGVTWAMAADRSAGEWRSWQTIDLPRPLPIRYIRINGLFNSANAHFHVVELEAYCVPPKTPALPRYASVPPP